MIRRPPRSTLFPYHDALPICKPFDFMTYPDRTHSISEGPGTTAHVFQLLTRYLTTHLPAGPREGARAQTATAQAPATDRKSTRLNSSHANISYAVFCLKKKQ